MDKNRCDWEAQIGRGIFVSNSARMNADGSFVSPKAWPAQYRDRVAEHRRVGIRRVDRSSPQRQPAPRLPA